MAIKSILKADKYKWNDDLVLVTSLTRACKLINDRVMSRLPIQRGLLDVLLHEISRNFKDQFYLRTLYCALFALGYYGLFRIGELTMSDHVVKAVNVHVATNKQKILVILYTSKTHNLSHRPQKIKIQAVNDKSSNRVFCPFHLMRQFIAIRRSYQSLEEPLFIFRNGSPVCTNHVRLVLKSALIAVGLDHSLYGFHSLRVGRTSDLVKAGMGIEQIKMLGRWKSNAVYKYIC